MTQSFPQFFIVLGPEIVPHLKKKSFKIQCRKTKICMYTLDICVYIYIIYPIFGKETSSSHPLWDITCEFLGGYLWGVGLCCFGSAHPSWASSIGRPKSAPCFNPEMVVCSFPNCPSCSDIHLSQQNTFTMKYSWNSTWLRTRCSRLGDYTISSSKQPSVIETPKHNHWPEQPETNLFSLLIIIIKFPKFLWISGVTLSLGKQKPPPHPNLALSR